MAVRIRGSFRRAMRTASRQLKTEVLKDANSQLRRALRRVKQRTESTGLVPKWLYGRTAESNPTDTVKQAWEMDGFGEQRRTIVEAVTSSADLGAELVALQRQAAFGARVYNDSMAFQPNNAFSDRFFANRVITAAFRSSGALGQQAIRFYGC